MTGMTLAPIDVSKSSLADTTYERLSEAMLRGELPPGTRLVMDDLARQFNVSRTPVRDALRRLETEGSIVPHGRQGYVVKALSELDVDHLYESRTAVEVFSARLVAIRGTSAIDALGQRLLELNRVTPDDMLARYRLNRDMHRAIVEATGNEILLAMFDGVWNRAKAVQIFEHFIQSQQGRTGDEWEHHRAIVDAMRQGPEIAADVMHHHIWEGHDSHLLS